MEGCSGERLGPLGEVSPIDKNSRPVNEDSRPEVPLSRAGIVHK